MRTVLRLLAAALVLTGLLVAPAVASAAQTGPPTRCAESGRVCAGLRDSGEPDPRLFGVAGIQVDSGQICLLGVELYEDGKPLTDTGRGWAAGARCATPGSPVTEATGTFTIPCYDNVQHEFVTHVTYLISGTGKTIAGNTWAARNRLMCA